MNEEEDAAEAAGKALEASLMRAARSVEGELSRIVRTGEADLERLALRIAETLARLAFERAPAGAPSLAEGETAEAGTASFNQFAATIARAAARGARFT